MTSISKQMGDLSLTGSVATMKVTIIGVGLSEKSKSAAALSTKPALTQSFSATVMLTIDNGKMHQKLQDYFSVFSVLTVFVYF